MTSFEQCPHEALILKAVQSGDWIENLPGALSASLQEHAATCSSCREVLEISRWMKQLSHAATQRLEIPNAAHVWGKAQLLQRQKLVERATRPISAFQVTAIFVFTSALSLWLVWKWSEVQKWFQAGTDLEWTRMILLMEVSSFPLEFLLFILAFSAATLIWMLTNVFAEE